MPTDRQMEFSSWLVKEMAAKNLGVRDLARLSGLSPARISSIKNGEPPGIDACNGLGLAFGIDGYLIAIRAGLFPEPKAWSQGASELASMSSGLPEDDIDELKDLARSKAEKHERRGTSKKQENR